MVIKQHKSGLWVREDGAVLMPPDGHRFFKFRWTFGSLNSQGYMMVHYRGKHYYVHRLVAETFIPNPNGYPTVDHYPNRDKTANFVENLRWADGKMQQSNRQICEDSLAKYGVRACENMKEYQRALRANNPEYAERERAICREWRAKNIERERAKDREYGAKQKALGRRYRKCPDGKHHWFSDAEYNEQFGQPRLF